MRQTITKSDKNLKILNKLIVNGFYSGYIGPEKFELIRNHFPNNHRLIGLLNNAGNYDLKFDFKSPLNIFSKILLGLGLLISIISLIKGNWILPIVFVVFGLIMFAGFKLKEKKEINIFTDKLLEFHKTEFD
ncbi:hypothetical protein MBM09_12865 [Flaviramulus sp. BrNp1-15]|uniref:hypothetical protein n=1 Tax=Flaviramulus sp. BrNp1-15 TaxID=2916754 RepID=UPI001EE84E1C|nr:hypothetical protein [Flaviramulus sp. BrNp1-15]ULC58795.1 hypothetical protein MBM09_12835 [Flaviramulus sp. BrNp1-15]ULC58801.1 hypothetical protein MBM09_12865 [Flaviramulus sp. BrNp1-15]